MLGYTTNEIAVIANMSTRQIRRIAQKENWKKQEEQKGAIKISYFDKTQVENYFGINQNKAITKVENKIDEGIKELDELPEWNQKIATARLFLCAKLDEYYEITDKSKMLAIKSFVEEAKERYKEIVDELNGLSESTLRRWYNLYKEYNGNPVALATRHGQNKGKRNITEEQKELIIKIYGDKNKPSVMKVKEQLLFMGHDISWAIINNFIKKDLPKVLMDNLREGKKEFRDNYEPFVLRNYKEKPNAVWMSDGHDFEMFCRKKDGTVGSPKIIVWQDHATRMWVGWTLSWKESIEPIVESLKNGIERWGKPDAVYTDNGRAYKSKTIKGEGELIGIYASLGIEKVHHALPYNAQAKAIERSFRDFKETFAKSFITYKGGNITERPERLKEILNKVTKNGKLTKFELDIVESIPTFEEMEELIEQFVEYRNHTYYKIRGGHRGEGMNGRTPLERMNEECPLSNRNIVESSKLRIMCMYEEIRVVQQAGIELKGQFYISPELFQYINQKVKVKYDYKNLRKIFVYKLTGEYLFEAQIRNKVAFFGSVDEIKRVSSMKKSQRQAIKKAMLLGHEIKESDIKVKEIVKTDMELLVSKNETREKEYQLKTWE